MSSICLRVASLMPPLILTACAMAPRSEAPSASAVLGRYQCTVRTHTARLDHTVGANGQPLWTITYDPETVRAMEEAYTYDEAGNRVDTRLMELSCLTEAQLKAAGLCRQNDWTFDRDAWEFPDNGALVVRGHCNEAV